MDIMALGEVMVWPQGQIELPRGGAATILVLQLTKTLLLSRVGEAAETQHGKQVWMRYNLNLNTSKQVSAIVS